MAQNGITVSTDWWVNIFYIIGTGSPAIISYLILKHNKVVSGFYDWIRNIFTFKKPIWMYLFSVGLCVLYYVSMIVIGGTGEMKPFYMMLVLVPFMVVGGGHEEAGWRYILQPALEKRFGFVLASLVVGVIWSLWHLPLFFIPGTGQYGTDFWIFAVYVTGLSFALGAIRKITDSVFLCVLFHCLFNAASTVFNPNVTWLNVLISTAILIFASLASVVLFKKRGLKKTDNITFML
ncbi:MAG: CPBP family intramembrane glutamic endopeptidase [Oscillospiraceae bacterium]